MFKKVKSFLLKQEGMVDKIHALIIGLVMVFIGLILVNEFAPELGNLTYSEGGIAGTIFDIMIWLVPLMAIVGLGLYAIKRFLKD